MPHRYSLEEERERTEWDTRSDWYRAIDAMANQPDRKCGALPRDKIPAWGMLSGYIPTIVMSLTISRFEAKHFTTTKGRRFLNALLIGASVAAFVSSANRAPGATLAWFQFPSTDSLAVSIKDANVTVSNFALSSGTIETNITTGDYFPNEPYIEETGGWTASNQDAAKYFKFTITANAGYTFNLTNIAFNAYATAAGPSAFGFGLGENELYSVNAPDSSLVSIDQVISSANGLTTTEVRIHGWLNGSRSSSGGGAFRLDDVVILGNVTASSGNILYFLGSDTTRGGAGTWETTGGSAWSSADADGGPGVAWDSAKTATFNSSAATVMVSGTVNANNGITFAAGSNGTTISGGTAIALGGATAGINTLTTETGITATIGTDLSGTAGLTKAGQGTLVLTGGKSYTGGTILSAGTLQLGDGTTNSSVVGAITNNATLAVNNGLAQTISNDITGSGAFTKTGVGLLTLSGANGYTGTTNISNGALRATHATALGTTAAGTTVANGAALEISGGIAIGAEALSLSGTGISDGGALRNISGTNSYGGAITLAAASSILSDTDTLTLAGIGGAGQNLTLGGSGNITVAGAIATTTGSLTKVGGGNVTLSGSNSYSGGTMVSGGTLTGTTTSLQGAITNNATVVFDQATAGTYAGAMSGSGSLTKLGSGNLTLSGSNNYAGGTTVSAGTLTGTTTSLQGAITNNAAVVITQSTNGTYAGAMSGAGTLTLTGSGTVTLSGDNSFSGGTTISGGTVVAAHNNALGSAASAVNGGTLFANSGITISNNITVTGAERGFIISEYIEGSSNNKYIELFNGTSSDITLGNYQLVLFSNGSATASFTTDLGALGAGSTLASGATLVLKNSAAALTLPSGVTAYNATTVNFSGDDALALQLKADGSNLDIFGRIGNDPGSAWTMGAFTTSDVTLVRNASVTMGITMNPTGTGPSAFTTLGTEWTQFSTDTVSNLGSHTMDDGAVILGSNTNSGTAIFSGNITLNSTAQLSSAQGGKVIFSGSLSNGSNGAKGITKIGDGVVVLSGTNTYTGATVVNAGVLEIEGSTSATSVVTVNSGGKLAGTEGTIGGNTTIASGGKYSAGTNGAVGIQTFSGNLNLASGSIFEWDLSAESTTTNFDKVTVGGTLTGSGEFRVVTDLAFNTAFWEGTQTWDTIFDGTSLTGWASAVSATVYDTAGNLRSVSGFGSFTISGTALTWTAIPEPTSALAGLLLASGLLRRRRPAASVM